MASYRFGNDGALLVIAGPCAIESEHLTLTTAETLAGIARRCGVPLIFKSSFDKANRSSGATFRGPGLDAGLRILEKVRAETGLPVLTDIHLPGQTAVAAQIVDVLQIPAFLARQTDLIVAAAATGLPVNIKKAQFMAPGDMKTVVAKAAAAVPPGSDVRLLLTERGTSFGYNNLVVDMRSLAIMACFGHPVIFDATHSVQLPGGLGDRSGGERQYIRVLARAAVAAGVDGLFLETHPDPDQALSDGPNAWPLDRFETLLIDLLRIHEAQRSGS